MIHLTKRQLAALRLLLRGGVRYGTMHADMVEMRDMGLAVAHDTGKAPPGKWTWRPTQKARDLIADMGGE